MTPFGAMAGLIAIALAGAAAAHDYRIGSVEIGHPAARATPPAARTGAAYLTVTNTGDVDVRLVGGVTEFAERVEIHEASIVDGVARMRPLADGVIVAPGETVELVPGGIHLMLIGLRAPLVEGDRVPIALLFDPVGEIEVDLAVEAIAAAGTDDHGQH